VRFYPLEKLINLHDGYARQFKIDSHQMLLLHSGGELFLIEGRCPHREQVLDGGCIEGDALVCPLHGYRFSIRSGQLLHASEEPCRSLRVYPVQYEGTEVGVLLED
jgi:nitrite reductase/ring-hydroxylating ferredoxin subunit